MNNSVLLHEPQIPGTEYDKDGSFVSFVNPPANSPTKQFGRDIIFLIDRSGSMHGTPFLNACNGMGICLDMISRKNNDRFGIVCFNHTQRYFNPKKLKLIGNGSMLEEIESGHSTHGKNKREEMGFDGGIGDINSPNNYNLSLFDATKENIEKGKLFVKDNYATGGTDIHKPLMWAVKMLEKQYSNNKSNNNTKEGKRVPFVVLLTDGAVMNEREIVLDCENVISNVRVLTFGIGKYCNWYFLKLLSIRSKGWQDGAMYSEDLSKRITSLMQRAEAPILHDLSIKGLGGKIVKNINDSKKFSIDKMIHSSSSHDDDENINDGVEIEMYPSQMSDLFIGSSVINAGRYHVLNNNDKTQYKFPQSVTICGTNVFDKKIEYNVNTDSSSVIPVNRVFIKERIDQLTAEEWLSQNKSIRKEIVQTSIDESFPSMYTSMVAVEITQKEKQELEKQRQEELNNDDNDESKQQNDRNLNKNKLNGRPVKL